MFPRLSLINFQNRLWEIARDPFQVNIPRTNCGRDSVINYRIRCCSLGKKNLGLISRLVGYGHWIWGGRIEPWKHKSLYY